MVLFDSRMNKPIEEDDRTVKGRRDIADVGRLTSYSKRAMNMEISVIRKKCPSCGHHKAFSKPSRRHCTKCRFTY